MLNSTVFDSIAPIGNTIEKASPTVETQGNTLIIKSNGIYGDELNKAIKQNLPAVGSPITNIELSFKPEHGADSKEIATSAILLLQWKLKDKDVRDATVSGLTPEAYDSVCTLRIDKIIAIRQSEEDPTQMAHKKEVVREEPFKYARTVPTTFSIDKRDGYIQVTFKKDSIEHNEMLLALGQIEKGQERIVIDLTQTPIILKDQFLSLYCLNKKLASEDGKIYLHVHPDSNINELMQSFPFASRYISVV